MDHLNRGHLSGQRQPLPGDRASEGDLGRGKAAEFGHPRGQSTTSADPAPAAKSAKSAKSATLPLPKKSAKKKARLPLHPSHLRGGRGQAGPKCAAQG